jgi:hypothetical protein
MPNKTSKKKRVVALPKIPKELIDQMVNRCEVADIRVDVLAG